MGSARLLFVALTLGTAGCDPAVHAAGRVRTPAGAPVVDAEVSLRVRGGERPELAWTDSLGRFGVTRLGSAQPPFELRVCREGYQVVARAFASLEALEDSVEFVLQAAAPSAVSSPGPRCSRPFRPAA